MPPTLLNNMTREIKQSPGTHARACVRKRASVQRMHAEYARYVRIRPVAA